MCTSLIGCIPILMITNEHTTSTSAISRRLTFYSCNQTKCLCTMIFWMSFTQILIWYFGRLQYRLYRYDCQRIVNRQNGYSAYNVRSSKVPHFVGGRMFLLPITVLQLRSSERAVCGLLVTISFEPRHTNVIRNILKIVFSTGTGESLNIVTSAFNRLIKSIAPINQSTTAFRIHSNDSALIHFLRKTSNNNIPYFYQWNKEPPNFMWIAKIKILKYFLQREKFNYPFRGESPTYMSLKAVGDR